MTKAILTGALLLTAAMAQERRFEYQTVQTFSGAGNVAFQSMPFYFEKAEGVIDTAVVKGAPYAADAVTETTQTLADGNRIHRTTKATLYRDSQGRTRREQTLGEVGPMVSMGEPTQTVMISDPVAGTTYMINSREKIAHKMPNHAAEAGNIDSKVMKLKAEAMTRTGIAVAGAGPGNMVFIQSRAGKLADERKNLKTEPLGTQMLEGVAADGTRTTLTIPAGQIGNEQPIQVVTETWYSQQLHTTVMTKTTDPRMGETVYKLTNIRLTEPDASLFAPPADMTVQ